MEAYAFLAMFTVQVLAISVLHPAWFGRYLRAKLRPVEGEHEAQRYIERRLTQYRALNTGIAVLGLVLLSWFVNYTRDPNWDDGPVEALLAVFFMMQMLPFCFSYWIVAKVNKALTLALPKRKASLQRRRLLDFVSPPTVGLAALVYLLFAALVIYLEQDPFPGFAGAVTNIALVTLLYALIALAVYMILYRTKTSPLETHAERMRAIERGVKVAIYMCIGSVAATSANMALILLDSQRWEPFAHSAFNMIFLLAFTCVVRSGARPSAPPDVRLGSSPVT